MPEHLPEEDRLQRGPAYSMTLSTASGETGDTARLPNIARSDWPTYRHDAARSGATDSAVPDRLAQLWEHELGGRISISSPVIAEGRLFVPSGDTHTVYALDAMAAANGRLYLTTQNGQVLCLGDGRSVQGAKELGNRFRP